MGFVQIKSVGENSLERVNAILSNTPNGARKAVYAALKRAGEMAKTQAGKLAAEEYTIKKSDFMGNSSQKVVITSVGGGVTEMKISFAGTVLPLLTFNTKASGKGLVTTQVKRNGGATTLQHAFVREIFGKTAVYEREGPERFPVKGLYGPSTGQMMQNENVVTKMEETIVDAYNKRIEHEITRILNGYGG